MFLFSQDDRAYQRLRTSLTRKADILSQQLDSSPEDYVVEVFRKANIPAIGGAMTSDGRRLKDRTPVELKPFLEIMLEHPPELSAYLVLYQIGKALSSFRLPVQLQGDIMMAFENANYFMLDKKTQAARHLAHALCIMRSLGIARSTLFDLGVPFRESKISQEEVQFLVKQGYLPQDLMGFTGYTYLGWNLEMRRAVTHELEAITPEASRLFQLNKMRSKEPQGIRRWEKLPNPEADKLLQEGMDEPNLEKAYDTFEAAGKLETLLLPDVWRNQAWILARWGRYDEAVTLCEKALEVDPEYAEVWYHMGICLSKTNRYSKALSAFETAKSLGFRKDGLEPNIRTCRHAIASGML